MKMKKRNWGKLSLLLLPLAAVIVGLSVWGPETLARYRDKGVLNQIQEQESDEGTKGYRYSLGGNEKVYILSRCLSSQVLPESEQSAMTRSNPVDEDLAGTYAFVANRKDASGQEVKEDVGIDLGNQAIGELKELGILPQEIGELTESSYSASLYSAIDVPDPQNNVLVWRISLRAAREGTDCLLDAYVDADTGKVYEFYARTRIQSWADVDADGIAAAWADYLGLEEPREYENANPLAENTPYFKKYTFAGREESDVVVTIGFYEGINELYLKISG